MRHQRSRWWRKWEWDAANGVVSPVPTRVISNEEYIPPPQTGEQRRVEWEIQRRARRQARALGMTRRQFLGTASGMATAFLTMNTVFGRFFDVEPIEAIEAAAAQERWPGDLFIFDIQTHHVAAPRQSPEFLRVRRSGRRLNPALQKDRGAMEDLYLENYQGGVPGQ